MSTSEPFQSGFVCLAGPPNVGKSTLLNRLVGQAVSITAPKPQTTRNRILGIKTTEAYQAVFVDTPGIHEAGDLLNTRMVGYATAALADADLVVVVMEPLRPPAFRVPGRVERVLELLARAEGTALLVINKIDLATEQQVLETIRRMDASGRFRELLPLSALTGKGVERLAAVIPMYFAEGPRYFEDDEVTDQTMAMLVAEFVRQEVFHRAHQEVPYSTAVRIEQMEITETMATIHARILVERDSQKGILIGKGGRMLKAIGTGARRRMEPLLATKVFLGLHVDVLKDWSANPRHLADLGYPEGGS